MTLEELKSIVASGEGETLEVKETTGQRVDACETLCAFLNKDGGAVVFGVGKNGKVTGQLVSDKTKRELFEVFAKFEPAADIAVEWVDVDEAHKAIVCKVERGNMRPYVYDGRPYKRVQSSTTVMPQEEYERMLAERKGFQSEWEPEINPDLKLADLDENEIRKTARMGVAEGRLPESTDINDVIGLLDGFKVRKDGALRNAAAVLFCKEDTDYMQCLLRLARFKGKENQIFIDNKQVTGNIFRLIDAGMAFCFNHLALSGVINGTYREEHLEVPAKALREALVNALVHRLYVKRGSSVSLAIYDDRVEIINPGTFPSNLTMAELRAGNKSEPRNPTIARVMYSRKTVETWGRGIKLMFDECAKANLPEPQIVAEGGYTKTVFMRPVAGSKGGVRTSDSDLSHGLDEVNRGVNEVNREVNQCILQILRSTPQCTIPVMAQLAKVSRATIDRAIKTLKEQGRIRRVGRTRGHWEVIEE